MVGTALAETDIPITKGRHWASLPKPRRVSAMWIDETYADRVLIFWSGKILLSKKQSPIGELRRECQLMRYSPAPHILPSISRPPVPRASLPKTRDSDLSLRQSMGSIGLGTEAAGMEDDGL